VPLSFKSAFQKTGVPTLSFLDSLPVMGKSPKSTLQLLTFGIAAAGEIEHTLLN